jgi:hypothetical protein
MNINTGDLWWIMWKLKYFIYYRNTFLLSCRPKGIYTHILWHPETHGSDFQFPDIWMLLRNVRLFLWCSVFCILTVQSASRSILCNGTSCHVLMAYSFNNCLQHTLVPRNRLGWSSDKARFRVASNSNFGDRWMKFLRDITQSLLGNVAILRFKLMTTSLLIRVCHDITGL